MSKPFKVLISGGGITGPVVAFWLARASTLARPIHITMIERASSVPKAGQGIDVEGPARTIVTRMGLFDTIKSRTTGEQGFRCLDNNDKVYAAFEQGGLTNETEIMRGDLCEVLTDAVKGRPNVELKYNRQITEIVQSKDDVQVTISRDDGQKYAETYNAVIASDGLRSRTRDLMLDSADTKSCIKTRDMYCSYFSIPAQPEDKAYSRWQHALGGRNVIIRPVTASTSSVYLIAVGKHPILGNSMANRDDKARRKAWADAFADVKYGMFPRVLREMQVTDNFYSDQIAQVKLPTWHKGRCAVVGDAAYCPSAITGQGTPLAILGAYLMAGELASNLDDPAAAFQSYEKRFRGFVEKSQSVPLGGRAPNLLSPQTRWGIWVLQSALGAIAALKVWKLLPEKFGEPQFDIPDYQFKAAESA